MPHTRVLKLGGSLLTLPDWPMRLRRWLSQHPCRLNLLLCGGGEIVESVRTLDASLALSAEFVHWICIDLLSTTTRIAGQLLPEFPIVNDRVGLTRILDGRVSGANSIGQVNETYLVDIGSFYSPSMPTQLLSEDWNTTSDSLAAYLARVVQAEEIVLFKSIGPPLGAVTPAQWEGAGIVDVNFSKVIVPGCLARIVNLKQY